MQFKFRNVNEAFENLVHGIYAGTIPTVEEPSRVGKVLRVQEPVMVTYERPWERVLFNTVRDCNPFFHLFEAMWMLAGSNQVHPLTYYNPRMATYSDDGYTLHGAYGWRWREALGIQSSGGADQLVEIANALRKDATCRRQVLTMWSTVLDLGKSSRDLPCNTHAYFAVNNGRLDMTVCNRSNDLIWGMLGANVVHFSFLQEYMACRVGVPSGHYHHITNNLHVYVDRWEPEKWLDQSSRTMHDSPLLGYGRNVFPSGLPLVRDPEQFDKEVNHLVHVGIDGELREPFLKYNVQPMLAAYRRHKRRCYQGDNNALILAGRVAASDWRAVSIQWLEKRRRAWEARSKVTNEAAKAAKEG